jgi:hypothetical protein
MEQLMQYIFQHRLWLQSDMHTVDGRRVEILDTGTLNTDAGPDFYNAKVKIDNELWVGNVEIHVRASDWNRHGHQHDEAYDSVILHVVGRDDMAVRRSNGEVIPQMLMTCAPDFSRRYNEMVNSTLSELPCAREIEKLQSIYITDWLSTLAYERLYNKVDHIGDLLARFNNDWSEVAYITIARALGFGVNSDPFERLALALPLKFMMKHRDSLLSVEALLFGQAGLLDSTNQDPYVQRLIQEYSFLATKFGLHPVQSLGWKMGRMRPQNFPHRRLATLAAFVHAGFVLGREIFYATTEEDLRSIFRIELTGYWSRRYNFSAPASKSVNALSESSITVLLINVAIPLIYAYGQYLNDSATMDRAISLMQSLKPENNKIVELFVKAGIKCPDAFTSQALIELRRQYCEPKKCLYCRIGHRLLAQKVKP